MKDKKQNKKKIFVSALALAVLGAGVVNVVKNTTVSAWGPERDTYTNASPAAQAVFNSITDNAAVGDERDFVRIVEVREDGERDAYKNELTIRGGHDYEVYIYYHNDASSTYNTVEQGYAGVARNVKVSAAFPESLKAGERGQVDAIISSERTIVPKVWDEAYVTAEENVTLAYISGSAKIFNGGKANGEVLATDLFSADGTLIGYNTLNGVVYGCDEYSGHIVYRVRATKVVEPSSTFEMDKKVSRDGGATWADDVTLAPGEEAEFKIVYKNTGTLTQKVTVFDTLESGVGMEYVAGTTRIVAGGTERLVQDATGGKLFDGGVDVGEVKAGETVEVYYKVKMKAASEFSCGKTVLYNLAGVSAQALGEGGVAVGGTATQHDKVRVEVTQEDKTCLPSELPSTGPAELALAGIVMAGLIVGVFYYVNSVRTLKKLETEATGGIEKPEQM